MKPLPTKPALLLSLVAMLLTGCPGKKPPATTAPPPPAPSAAPQQPAPQPAEAQPQAQTSQAPTQGTPPSDQKQDQPASAKTETNKSKLHAAKRTASHPPPSDTKIATETARNAPPKIIINADSAAPGQISPSLSQNEAAHDQVTTEQLLQSTEVSLSSIKRQLSPDEEAMVTHIKDYITQSRMATKANDLVRAHNLATKAHLLSDELAKRQ